MCVLVYTRCDGSFGVPVIRGGDFAGSGAVLNLRFVASLRVGSLFVFVFLRDVWMILRRIRIGSSGIGDYGGKVVTSELLIEEGL